MPLPLVTDRIPSAFRRVMLFGVLAAALMTAPHGQAREPDTVYDWPALQAAAAKRVAADPYYPGYISDAKKKNGPKTAKWSKGSRWMVPDIRAALKRGASPDELLVVMAPDYDGATIDQPGIMTLMTSAEWKAALAKRNDPDDPTSFKLEVNLWGHVLGRSRFADELALEVIARRQKDVTLAKKPLDSPALRQRLASGDAEAAYQLYLLYHYSRSSADRTPVPTDLPSADDLVAQAVKGYAPAQWLVAQKLENNSDKTKNDPVRAFELRWKSAQAGDAIGAFKLAQQFSPPNDDYGVARNFAESEYWFIEAAVRSWPGQMDLPFQQPDRMLALLYSVHTPVGLMMPAYQDATARWLRTLLARGGALTDFARLAIKFMDDAKANGSSSLNYEHRIARIPAEIPALPEAEWQRVLNKAKGNPAELMRVAESYAGGRRVRQNDVQAVAYHRLAAEAGAGLPAYQAIVQHYHTGIGVNKDPVQELVWMTKAADTGDIPSIIALGNAQYFWSQNGIPENLSAAKAAYEKASALGSGEAWYRLGVMYEEGKGVPTDAVKARELFEQAAKLGDISAMKRIAQSYLKGTGKDYAQAAAWYQKAVDAGDKYARFDLGKALYYAEDNAGAKKWFLLVAQDNLQDVQSRVLLARMADGAGQRDEAIKWYREVAQLGTGFDTTKSEAKDYIRDYDQEERAKPGELYYNRKLAKSGDLNGMFDYAMQLSASNVNQARIWLARAADKGHELATGVYYADYAKTDKPRADQWLKTQADKGNGQAMVMVGLLTAQTDKAAGLALIQKAATAGNGEALFRIGTMQYQGQELPQDRPAGIARIRESAGKGFPMAQFTLGKGLLAGDVGLTADPREGLDWLKRAMAQNTQPAAALQAAVLLGQVYEQGTVAGIPQDLPEALAAFGRACQIDPNNQQLRTHYEALDRRLAMERKRQGG